MIFVKDYLQVLSWFVACQSSKGSFQTMRAASECVTLALLQGRSAQSDRSIFCIKKKTSDRIELIHIVELYSMYIQSIVVIHVLHMQYLVLLHLISMLRMAAVLVPVQFHPSLSKAGVWQQKKRREPFMQKGVSKYFKNTSISVSVTSIKMTLELLHFIHKYAERCVLSISQCSHLNCCLSF